MGNAQADTSDYLNGYPDKVDPPLEESRWNLDFYEGKVRLNGERNAPFIDDIHARWHGEYALLEQKHDYIQWIFPIREFGMNDVAVPLTLHEAEAIRASPETAKRVVQSYRMMLDFYGLVLDDEATGAVSRAPNCADRFYELNNSFHNYLRITRILKSLGELGLERYKLPLVRCLAREVFEARTLANAAGSLCDYWIPVLRVEAERTAANNFVTALREGRGGDEGVGMVDAGDASQLRPPSGKVSADDAEAVDNMLATASAAGAVRPEQVDVETELGDEGTEGNAAAMESDDTGECAAGEESPPDAPQEQTK